MQGTHAGSASRFSEVSLSRAALQGLAQASGLRCGPLSLLARLEPPESPPDLTALRGFLEGLTEPFDAAAPALLDPHLTVGLAVADAQTQVIGQYAWPDPAGILPGFKLVVRADSVGLAGPVTPDDVRLGLQEFLQLGTVPESLPGRLTVSADQFWALAALVDAGAMTVAARRAAHVSGPLAGVRWEEILASWQRSVGERDLAWATSLAASLLPEALPRGDGTALRRTLAEMEEAGLVVLLEASGPDDPLGDVYLLVDTLEQVCGALGAGALLFGASVQRRTAPAEVERAVVMGWRTSAGIVVADLTRLLEGAVTLLGMGPTQLVELLSVLLGPAGFEQALHAGFQPAFSREALLAALPDSVADADRECPACHQRLGPDAAFCRSCGHALREEAPAAAMVCGACGGPTSAGAAFCRSCGAALR